MEGNYGSVQIPEITGTMEKQTMLTNGDEDIEVKKNGYLYVYVSNESKGSVFFDNLAVTHIRGPVLEETHYYPFGLTMNGISSKALAFGNPENKRKYNGIEQNTDFDLNMYDAQYRNLDPQVGRFWQIDPKPNEIVSAYAAMLNNPILFSDPLGDTTWVYGNKGNYLGVINDNLANQVHFLNREGAANPFDASKLSLEDAINLANSFRNESIAFIGSNTVEDMKSIAKAADSKGFELGFVAEISESKEIRLTQLPDKYHIGDTKYDISQAIDDEYSKEQQSKLFGFGHVHLKKFAADISGYDGYTGEMAKLIKLGRPSQTSDREPDYQPFLNRQSDGGKGQSPAFIISAYGFTVYGTGTRYNPALGVAADKVVPVEYSSYMLYKKIKR